MTDSTSTQAIEDDMAGLSPADIEHNERAAAQFASYVGKETEERVSELENRLVPDWPAPVTDEHFELMASGIGMSHIEFIAESFSTADLAFWLIMHARLGRFPTYEELKTMAFRAEAAGRPVSKVLERAMMVYLT